MLKKESSNVPLMGTVKKRTAPSIILIYLLNNRPSVDPLTQKNHKLQYESMSGLWKIISCSNQDHHSRQNKLLRSDELLHACRWPEPPIYPALVLQSIHEAQAVFELHRMPERAVAARIASAFMLCQLGEERNAIAIVNEAISKPSLLKAEAMARAIYILAMAHGRLGELDTAFDLIESRGHEFARMAKDEYPWLPAMMTWAKALLLWKAFLFRHHQDLWHGPPPDSGLVRLGNAAPDRDTLRFVLEKVGRQLPADREWPYCALLLHALEGLDTDRDGMQPIEAIEKIGVHHQMRNPPVAAWAWLSCSLVHCARRQYAQALQASALARSMAGTYQLDGIHRNALVYEFHIHETRGDYPAALSTLKSLNIMRLKSVAVRPLSERSSGNSMNESRLRDLEPAHVKRALQFIDGNIDKKLRIQAIADHCQVSRRTLEISFKNSRSCSIGDYIRQSKIHLAAEYLLTTEQTIGQISSRLGYSSLSTFSRDFSAHYGIPPSLWLRHHRTE